MNMPDQQVPAGPGMDPQEVVRAVEEFTRNPPPEVVERLRETAEESRRRRQTPELPALELPVGEPPAGPVYPAFQNFTPRKSNPHQQPDQHFPKALKNTAETDTLADDLKASRAQDNEKRPATSQPQHQISPVGMSAVPAERQAGGICMVAAALITSFITPVLSLAGTNSAPLSRVNYSCRFLLPH